MALFRMMSRLDGLDIRLRNSRIAVNSRNVVGTGIHQGSMPPAILVHRSVTS
jgi:hypothetical protein